MFDNVLFFGRQNCKYSNLLKKYLKNNSKKLIYIESKKKNEKLNLIKIKNITIDFIFCFRSFYILKSDLIKRSKYGVINFHPGIPKYRGVGAVNFAIYEDNKYYGSTAHYIENHLIDKGKIIDVSKFKLKKKSTIEETLKNTHSRMYLQSKKIIKNFLKDNLYYLKNNKIKKYVWSKKLYTSKDLNNLYEIKIKFKKSKIKRIIKATYTKKYKPYIKIDNQKYYLIK